MLQSRDAEFRFFDCDGLVCTNAQYFDRHGERFASALIPNGVDPEIFYPPGTATNETDPQAEIKGISPWSEAKTKGSAKTKGTDPFNGGDLPWQRARYGLPPEKRIALMVSALIPSKRVSDGVRAVAAIADLFLVVAGDGECREEVDREAQRLLPERYLRISLPRGKMPGLYRFADVFLHLSRDEASANAYMEALATGLPIVTHDWEVTRWTLEDQAFLVDSNQPHLVTLALARAIDSNSPAAVQRTGILSRGDFRGIL